MNEVWSDDTLRLGPCLPVHGPGNQVLHLGPRVKMGIYEGRPNRICPHTTTGRADYFGPFVNRQTPCSSQLQSLKKEESQSYLARIAYFAAVYS